jgi:non-heme chloroperoxidase
VARFEMEAAKIGCQKETYMSHDTGKRRIESISLPASVTLHYARQGSGTGTPLVFLHGVTDSWRSFEGLLSILPAEIPAYAISQRGHGDSSRPAAGYLYQDLASDLRFFMEALDLPPAVVAGHSMGAMVAKRFAADYPDRVAGLVLMGGWASLHGHRVFEEFATAAMPTLTDPIDPAFVREFQLSTLAREVPAQVVETAVSESLKVPAYVWRAAFEGFLSNDSSADSERIAAPTLIAWGDRDLYANRSDQDALLARIGESRLVVYEGAGHAFHWEDPASFAADLVPFVRALPQA